MPEPWSFLRATFVAAALGFVLVAAASCFRRLSDQAWIGLLAIAAGFAAGCYVFPIEVRWPPASGLDRFLLFLLPAAFAVELVASAARVSGWIVFLLRVVVAAGGGMVLLYGSVYFTANSPWPLWQIAALLVLCPTILTAERWLLLELERRSPSAATKWSMAIAIASAGMMVMLGGYIKGGAVAFPLAAAIAGASIWPARGNSSSFQSSLGFTLMGLFGILFVGEFFGRISLVGASVVLLAPLLGWASELLPQRLQKPWLVAVVRIAAVAIPLVVVLAMAKQDFDRKAGPLLAVSTAAVTSRPANASLPAIPRA